MSLWQDVRFGLRMLVKDRWFTLAAATALALGIGVNAMVFTLVNAVLVRNLPFRDPTRIMAVKHARRPRPPAPRVAAGLRGLAADVAHLFGPDGDLRQPVQCC
jgi:hypothetical protein